MINNTSMINDTLQLNAELAVQNFRNAMLVKTYNEKLPYGNGKKYKADKGKALGFKKEDKKPNGVRSYSQSFGINNQINPNSILSYYLN